MTTLTVTTARSLGDLKARIADEIARSDLTSQIALAIDDAIDIASINRFWFNEVRGTELVLAAGQAYYETSDTDALVKIDSLYLLLNGSQRWNIRPASNARLNQLYNGTPASGLPSIYSRYNTQIRFWPTPDQPYVAFFDGLTRGEPMESDSDSSIWTTYGEKLIRSLAKRELYAHVIRDKDEAVAHEQLAEAYLNDLLRQTDSQATTGEMVPFGV